MNKIVFCVTLLSFWTTVHSQEATLFFPDEELRSLPEPPCTAYNGQTGTCKLLAECSTFFAEIAQLSRSPCTISEDQQGICCPPNKVQTRDPSLVVEKGDKKTPPEKPLVFPDISVANINDACEKSVVKQVNKDQFKKELAQNNVVAEVNSPVFLHARLFETTNEIFDKSKDAETILDATDNLKITFALDKEQAENGLSQFDVKDTVIKDRCPTDPICPNPNYSYRTMDGSCNNLRHKDWGKTGQAFTRMLPAQYEDGVKEIRLSSKTKSPLPSARLVSTEVSPAESDLYVNLTILIWQWGQFLDHDVTHTPISKGADKDVDISCCRRGQLRPENELDPNCFPIDIPENDKFYAPFGRRCMEFVRSMAAIRPFCKFGPREQMNQITSYLDASNVYGSTAAEMRNLRSFKDGKLLVFNDNGRELLPANKQGAGCIARRVDAGRQECFLAGDTRVNEQPDLAVMHTIWMRQHNKIVEALKEVNPGWNDEILFQEGRRIVAAQMQHITYNEYLPIVLGREFMETYGLLPLKEGYSSSYRDDVDGTVTNAFATAAFRYGHTLITDTLQGFNKFGGLDDDLVLSETQFVPFSLYDPQVLDNLIRGLALQPSQKFDRFFSDQLTNKLFAQSGPFGMDLVALNIQRGRDHGLPPYTKWREVCDLSPIRSWQELSSAMSPQVIASMQSVYESVDDIDLFIGGIAENTVEGTLLGPTFLCILGRQFIKMKIGDRFYYENGNSRDPLLSQFTEGQLKEIRKTTLSRVLCDTSDNIELMQPLAFVTAHLANKRSACRSGRTIPKMSLRPWANRPIWTK